jgi:hypothetical protein
MGLDLTVVGLLGVFSVCEVALRRIDLGRVADLHSIEMVVVIFQFALVGLAVVFLSMFDSPERSFKRGVFIPNLIGWLSIIISVGLFYMLTSGYF